MSRRAGAFDAIPPHDLISLPDAPVEIILMPEFQQGVAVAYCDPPGPLDRDQPTFYAVSPIPDAWTDAQASSFLREYNARSIQELTIHEAMPGHYVQLWRLQPPRLRAPRSVLFRRLRRRLGLLRARYDDAA